jgi:hypothetical protein
MSGNYMLRRSKRSENEVMALKEQEEEKEKYQRDSPPLQMGCMLDC